MCFFCDQDPPGECCRCVQRVCLDPRGRPGTLPGREHGPGLLMCSACQAAHDKWLVRQAAAESAGGEWEPGPGWELQPGPGRE